MNALDRSIKTVDQAETTFGLPVLAAIPEVSRNEGTSPQQVDTAPPGTSSYRLVAEAPRGECTLLVAGRSAKVARIFSSASSPCFAVPQT